MIDKAATDLLGPQDIVRRNIADVVDEIRAVDLADMISFIRFESYPTVEDLVNSSTELFFKPEMLVFAWAAAVDVRWDACPAVTLGLEFRHPDVSVFFNLTIRDGDETVEILGVSDPEADLSQAFAEARLPVGGDATLGASEAGLPLLPPPAGPGRKGLPWR